ncbi:MAG: glycosyl transferase, group 1 [uncultured Solirubrobacteraceae bacterium]|uniref:Glycosyl transferase, group 1 n=1 Tax=uncultured Solirubrobacteraceae bacterium TaxID=1162706 RepID=A0A6J4RZM9_9ACTN|nr:MAG: glycosyl transferase, group 1 [uncultured Solirubrobacteraceae bacterium]
MHVALNLVFLVPGETGGMEVMARELVARLADVGGLRLTALVSREGAQADEAPWGRSLPMVTLPVNSRNRAEWVRGEQQHIPRVAKAIGADIVHSLGSTAPLWGPYKRVTTIHDLHYKLVPEAHFGLRGLGMRVLVPLAARRSHRILAVSHATRRDLVEHLGTPAEKIDVVPNGVAAPGETAATPADALRARFEVGARRVLLSVSAKRPHKNLLRLLDALAGIPAERRPLLIVPGYPTPHEDELRRRAEALGIAGDVALPAWVSAADLEGLYGLADAFVFPSLYEGFGLPLLEAMRRGVPVASSDRGSLPEVAGDAALLFDPEDTAAMRAAIERLLADEAEAARLRAAGFARVQAFSWEKSAELTAAAYRRVLADGR